MAMTCLIQAAFARWKNEEIKDDGHDDTDGCIDNPVKRIGDAVIFEDEDKNGADANLMNDHIV